MLGENVHECLFFYLLNLLKKLQRTLGHVSHDRRSEKKMKKSIKINSVLPHSFTDKQQLHRIGINIISATEKQSDTGRYSESHTKLECSVSSYLHLLNVKLNHLFCKEATANKFILGILAVNCRGQNTTHNV